MLPRHIVSSYHLHFVDDNSLFLSLILMKYQQAQLQERVRLVASTCQEQVTSRTC